MPTRSMPTPFRARVWMPGAGLALAAVLLAAGMPRPAGAEGRYALLVGVENYDESELARLKWAEDDMEAVGRALGRLGFDVVTMTSGSPIPARRPVLPEDILTQVDRRLADRQKTDTVILAFSGHGVQLKEERPGAGGAKELYFCPERAKPGDPKSLVAMSEVIRRLDRCVAGRKVLLVDACRSNYEPPNGTKSSRVIELPAAGVKRPPTPAGMVAMFSCSPGEQSFEIEALEHSIFSHHLIRFLEGHADPDRYPGGEVRITELTTYVQSQTRQTASSVLDRSQEPHISVRDGTFADWPLGTLDALAGIDRKPGMKRPLPAVPPVPAGPRPGRVIENSLGMRLVEIPAGQFRMGGTETPEQLQAAGFIIPFGYDTADERPVHQVAITKPFLLGQTEVTLGEFLVFYNDGFQGKLDCEKDGQGGLGYDSADSESPFQQKPAHRPWNWGHPDMDLTTEAGKQKAFRHPVVNVSWNDAVAFCEWLSNKEGKRYRLPTEAEWEYACRAGTTKRFWTGDDPEALAASENVADASFKARFPSAKFAIKARDSHTFTAPVGSFDRPNPFGLFDMHGNVAEWCGDWYDKAYYGQSPAADPKGPNGPSSAGSFRVFRGGCWNDDPASCRSAYRSHGTPAGRNDDVGFRVVCEFE